jgi:hypothetical protein
MIGKECAELLHTVNMSVMFFSFQDKQFLQTWVAAAMLVRHGSRKLPYIVKVVVAGMA